MSIYMCNGQIRIPFKPDVVYCDDRRHASYGKRGTITRSDEGQCGSFDCDYLHNVAFEDGTKAVLDQNQVCFEDPKRPKPKRARAEDGL